MGGIPIMRGVGTVHHDPRVSPAGAAELACCGRPRHGVRQLRHASSSHPHTGSAAKRRVCRAVQQSVDEHTVGSHDASGSSSGVIAPLDDVAVPAELQRVLTSAEVVSDLQQRYASLQQSRLAPLLRWRGFEERLLADPSFMVKVGIEVGIGICTKSAAEATKRGANFSHELDFVAANIIMALVADFCLVWLPAPRADWRSGEDAPLPALQNSPVYSFVQSCPGNCFQTVQPGTRPYSLQQRAGALAINFAKLLAVGTTASLVGVGVVNGLTVLRQAADPGWTPLNPPQNILATSLLYGTYMGVSSNLRYQIIAGVLEERIIEKVFHGKPQLCAVLSFVVRTSNTFIGSLLWVDFIRLMGMQSAGPH